MDASTTLGAAVLTITTVATLIFGPYPFGNNLLCNNGTQWTCYCSVTNKATLLSSAPVCLNKFENLHAVSVDFHECKLNLNAVFQQYENRINMETYVKNYIVGLMKQECAMSSCQGYRGPHVDMQIVFILLACSNDGSSRLLLNAFQQNGSVYEQIPAETLARVLADMSELLHNGLGSTVLGVSVVNVPRFSTAKSSTPSSSQTQERQQPEIEEMDFLGISRTALIAGSAVVACLIVLSVITGILCYRQKRRLRFKKRGGESTKKNNNSSSSSNGSSNDCLQPTSKLMQHESAEMAETVVYTNSTA